MRLHSCHRRAEMSTAVHAGEPRISCRLRNRTVWLLNLQLSGQRTPVCAGFDGDFAYPLDDDLSIPCCIVQLHIGVLGDTFTCARLIARTRRTCVRHAVLVAWARILVRIIRHVVRRSFESRDADRRSSLDLRSIRRRRLDNLMRVFPAIADERTALSNARYVPVKFRLPSCVRSSSRQIAEKLTRSEIASSTVTARRGAPP